MAIYHLEGKIVSRAHGRSSVAAACYRSAEKHLDERTGLTHNFEKKEHDILHKEILLPEDAPTWMQDRGKLWNHVEQTEKRKDAQLAREFNISLPKELTTEQNIALAKAYLQEHFVKQGMIADLCIHRGHKGGEEQPHMHVMLTMREVNAQGFGQKARQWNDKALINTWREGWAETCNAHLARHGHDIRIDHRTLEAQGIHLEPQTKIGPKAAQHQMAQYEEHQRIARENGERLYQNPEIALTAITTQQSTFTHQDLARLVNRHTVDGEQFTKVYERVKTAPGIVYLGEDKQGRARYTTQEMLTVEEKLMTQVNELSQTHDHTVSNQQLNRVITQRANQGKPLSAEQAQSLEHILQGKDVACVVGYAGTGKSYMLGAAKEAWEAQGYKVQGMTLSGIAAENLEGGSGIKSHTVANRITCWNNAREQLTAKNIVVVDEAGMLGTRQLAHIVDEAKKAGSKVVLVGDPEQLQAIAAGPAFRGVIQEVGHCELTEIRRQKHEWQQEATRELAQAKTYEALARYDEKGFVESFNTQTQAIDLMAQRWQEVRSNNPNATQLMLAYTRAEVAQLNEKARELRQDNGELGQDHLFQTINGRRAFAAEDRIYFLKNEKSLGVKNGTLGTIERINGNNFTVRTDGSDLSPSKQVTFSIKDYEHIDHGYAATVYKAQGVTVDRSHVLASKYFDRHSTYVALTRHKESATLYWSREEFSSSKMMSLKLGQARHKDLVADYARVRGLAYGEIEQRPEIKVNKAIRDNSELSTKQKAVSLDMYRPEIVSTAKKFGSIQELVQVSIKEKLAVSQEQERAMSATERLNQRQHMKALNSNIAALEKSHGIKISIDTPAGTKGRYALEKTIDGKSYIFLEDLKDNKHFYLVPKGQADKCKTNEVVTIDHVKHNDGSMRIEGHSKQSVERELEARKIAQQVQQKDRWFGRDDNDRGRSR